MIRILKSEADKIDQNFAEAVEQYRQALLDHRFSEPACQYVPAVPAGPATPAVKAAPAVPGRRGQPGKPATPGRPAIPGTPARPAIPAHPGTPRPVAHPIIEACVVRVQVPGQPDDFIAQYEIVDDTPVEVVPDSEKDLDNR